MIIDIKLRSLVAIFLLIFFSLFFYCNPIIDQSISMYFFRNTMHVFFTGVPKVFENFYIVSQFSYLKLAHLMQHILYPMVTVFILAVLAVIIFGWYQRKFAWVRGGIFVCACFIIGPGLLVNTTLKNHWGRPRPRNTALFLGDHTFQRPWVISHACKKNCSFVAGDSSVAFTFLSLAFLPSIVAQRRRRKKVIVAVTVFSAINAFFRVSSGAHYFSDVVIGLILIYLSILLCYQICYRWLNPL
jgi:lipid A 4'-phosphatase